MTMAGAQTGSAAIGVAGNGEEEMSNHRARYAYTARRAIVLAAVALAVAGILAGNPAETLNDAAGFGWGWRPSPPAGSVPTP
jgi:hypothetical protein